MDIYAELLENNNRRMKSVEDGSRKYSSFEELFPQQFFSNNLMSVALLCTDRNPEEHIRNWHSELLAWAKREYFSANGYRVDPRYVSDPPVSGVEGKTAYINGKTAQKSESVYNDVREPIILAFNAKGESFDKAAELVKTLIDTQSKLAGLQVKLRKADRYLKASERNLLQVSGEKTGKELKELEEEVEENRRDKANLNGEVQENVKVVEEILGKLEEIYISFYEGENEQEKGFSRLKSLFSGTSKPGASQNQNKHPLRILFVLPATEFERIKSGEIRFPKQVKYAALEKEPYANEAFMQQVYDLLIKNPQIAGSIDNLLKKIDPSAKSYDMTEELENVLDKFRQINDTIIMQTQKETAKTEAVRKKGDVTLEANVAHRKNDDSELGDDSIREFTKK